MSSFAVVGSANAQASTKWHEGTPTALRGKWKTPRLAITAHKVDRFRADTAHYVVKMKLTKKAFYFSDGDSATGIPSKVKWRKTGKNTYQLKQYAEDTKKWSDHFTIKRHNRHSASVRFNGYSYWGWNHAGTKVKYLTKY